MGVPPPPDNPMPSSNSRAFAYDSVVGHDLIGLLQQESSDFAQRADTFAALNPRHFSEQAHAACL